VLRGGRGRPLGVLLLGLLAALVLIPEVPGLRALRSASFDAYQSLVPRVRRVGPVVIVAIDEESLRRYGQWPWPRPWLARIVGNVADGRPAAIGIDILMPEPGPARSICTVPRETLMWPASWAPIEPGRLNASTVDTASRKLRWNMGPYGSPSITSGNERSYIRFPRDCWTACTRSRFAKGFATWIVAPAS